MTIPYAFGMAALITGHLDDSWLRAVRRWTMFSWLFLSLRPDARDDLGVRGARLGRLLGLGPGRERRPAAVVHRHRVPALGDGAGAARHAARLERHARHHHVLPDDLRHLHDALGRRAVGARVRRGPDAGVAVHACFMVAILLFSFGLVIWRLPLLRSRHELDSWISREAAFLAEQLDPAVCGALRAVRHDVPDAERGADGASG